MALKVKAKERLQKIGKYAGTYRYVMLPELYNSLSQEKVIREAALRSGVSEGVMQACWDALNCSPAFLHSIIQNLDEMGKNRFVKFFVKFWKLFVNYFSLRNEKNTVNLHRIYKQSIILM